MCELKAVDETIKGVRLTSSIFKKVQKRVKFAITVPKITLNGKRFQQLGLFHCFSSTANESKSSSKMPKIGKAGRVNHANR